jgi:hypothetical protein
MPRADFPAGLHLRQSRVTTLGTHTFIVDSQRVAETVIFNSREYQMKSQIKAARKQAGWLEAKARALGFVSLVELLQQAPKVFEGLAGQWRVLHPE